MTNDLDSMHFDVDTFEHLLGHISKAAGKLHGLVGDAEHIEQARPGMPFRDAFAQAEAMHGKDASVYIADLIVCAQRLAALCPSGAFDLAQAVADRVSEKRNYLDQYRAG